MPQPNIHEVRENLAEYLAAAQRGEEVLICRRNQPVARLVAVARQTGGPRPLGRGWAGCGLFAGRPGGAAPGGGGRRPARRCPPRSGSRCRRR